MGKWFFAKGQFGNFVEEGDTATTDKAGLVKVAVIKKAASTPTKAEFNALVDALIEAGIAIEDED